jgi:hypothetical protein
VGDHAKNLATRMGWAPSWGTSGQPAKKGESFFSLSRTFEQYFAGRKNLREEKN